jgi:hypothetical protein
MMLFVQEIIQATVLLALLSAATAKQIYDLRNGGRAAPLSFAIWTAVNVVSVSAQVATQPTPIALLLPVGQLVSMGLILGFALRSSQKSAEISSSQRTAVLLCLAGLGAWIILRDPMYAIAGNVVANIAGVLPTWEQAWKHPRTISFGYWLIEGGTVLVGLLVVVLHAPGHLASLVPQLTGAFICWSILGIRWVRLRPMRPTAEVATDLQT